MPSGRAWLALPWLGLAAAAYVALAEVGTIVAEATPTGGSTLSALFGFGQLTGIASLSTTTATLTAWVGTAGQLSHVTAAPSDLHLWLFWYLGFDLLFIAGYAMTGVILLPLKRTEPAQWLLLALVAVHVVQDVIAAVAFAVIASHGHPGAPLAIALHVAAAAKWLAALALLVRVAYLAWDVKTGRRAIGSVAAALSVQRYSVVLVTLVTVIAAGHGMDILQQMPDVPRAWLTRDGWEPALVAMTAEALLAVLLMFLGRMRTRRAKEKYSGTDSRRDPGYVPWLGIPLVLVVLAVLLRLAGVAEVGWARVVVAAAVPLAIGISSLAIAWFSPAHTERSLSELWPWLKKLIRGGSPQQVTDHRDIGRDGVRVLGRSLPSATDEAAGKVASARVAGDILAVAAVAVPGLGLVRSFTAPALLVGGWYAAASWAAIAIGLAFATLTWPAANGPGRVWLRKLAGPYKAGARRSLIARIADSARHGPRGKPQDKSSSDRLTWQDGWPWLVVSAPFLIADGCLLAWPLWAAHWLGVLGTTVISLCTLTVVLAVLGYVAQTRRPVPLFRILRLNVTPVLSVILVVGFLGGIVDSKSLLHVARGPVNTAAQPGDPAQAWGAPGTTFADALSSWLDDKDTARCAIPASDASVRVQPLILVAAAGGGIRAAWWAEQAMAMFAGTRCGRHDVFAVSSVSGGSVGMAILDTAPPGKDGGPDVAADAAIKRIAGPDALAAGLNGLLLHDLIAGFTGLDLPAAQMPPRQPFADRADLMESTWSNEDAGLRQPFPLKDPPLPWQLLFNSTTVGSGCRAIIASGALPATPGPATVASQPAGAPPGSPLTCDLQTSAVGGGSYDFFARLHCQQGIAAVTAAMLSARFPIVTPSGVITGCEDQDQQGLPVGQFVDGGYADSSGLFTVADLIPAVTSAVRAFNAKALAQAGQSGQPATLVVPLVMYLGNSPRAATVTAPVPALAAEPTLPLSTQSAGPATLAVSDTLLQRIGGLIGNGQWLACPPDDSGCANMVTEAQQVVGGQQLFLVAPGVVPQVSVPLGWVLSPASQQSLNQALTAEARYRCAAGARNVPENMCEPGVGHLGDLLALTSRA